LLLIYSSLMVFSNFARLFPNSMLPVCPCFHSTCMLPGFPDVYCSCIP